MRVDFARGSFPANNSRLLPAAIQASGLASRAVQLQSAAGRSQKFSQPPTNSMAARVQQGAPPPVYRPQAIRQGVQPRMGNGVMVRQLPEAPPVYRPPQAPRVLQTKSSSTQNSPASHGSRQPGALSGYGPESTKRVQPVGFSQQRTLPAAPPVYRPEQARIAQPRMVSAVPGRTLVQAPPVYRPQAKPVSVQLRATGSSRVPNRSIAPPVYRPGPVFNILQSKKNATHNAVVLPSSIHAARSAGSGSASSRTIQRVVNLLSSDVSANGKYIVDRANSALLYSTLDAAPPQPYGLYARGKDFYWSESGKVGLNSWRPNVRFIDKTEAAAEPVIDKPGTYRYKTKTLGFDSSETYSVKGLQTEVWNPDPGLDGPPLIGALGKNDCNIWATTLQNLIADEKGAVYEIERGRQESRTVRIQAPTTTLEDLTMKVGDLMKHIYEGPGACNYHAATVVAQDGASLITLEGHVSKNLSRPQFHIRGGLTGFADEGIQHQKGDKVDIIPVTSLTYDSLQDDKETREKRFRQFGEIDADFWKDYEGINYSYRGRLAGDIGITSTREKRRRDELARINKPLFGEIYAQTLRERGKTPTYTSFPRID